MKRREFITLLGGAATACPLTARAQQLRMRRIGVLVGSVESDPGAQAIMAAIRQELQELGWTEGRNVRIDMRSAGGDVDRSRRYSAELVALAPDIILAISGFALGALLPATRTVPIVFMNVVDPVGAGFVASLARPGGNATGFTDAEYGTSGKLLELLKEIVPRVTRVAVLRDRAGTTGAGLARFAAIQAVAPSFRVELSPVNVRDSGEIDGAVTAFARVPNGGLIVLDGTAAVVHREQIIMLAARHRLPAVYGSAGSRAWITGGGLISYGPVTTDQYRLAAGYVDRILKGEKPADLPVQLPTKYETVLNMKTAKALGLEVPTSVLLRADEVIE